MNENSYDGLALIRSSQANLEWWINSDHSKKLSKQGYDLIVRIMKDFNAGINNVYHFIRPALLHHIDGYINGLMKEDPIAQAIDIRIIYNLPEGETLNEAYIIKAAPYNITYNG